MTLSENILGENEQESNYSPKITIEQIQHIFEYATLNDLISTGDESLSDEKLGRLIDWKTKPYYFTGYNDIPAQTVPVHIKWSNNPLFAYVSISDNKIQYHWSEDGGSAVFICPTTTNPEHIKYIDKLFEHYYNKFNLPNSLKEIKVVKQKANKKNKIKFLEEYLLTKDPEFFKDNFCDDEDIDDIVMCIDWREEDENIITYCEEILQTNQLFVETFDADNDRGFETIITYKNQETIIPYIGEGADRDTTIKTLNKTIKSDFEIRLCKESYGSDTLCFIPLTNKQWLRLDKKYQKQVTEKFEKITTKTRLFD